MNNNERVEWVESELKKWEERFEIPFEMEFSVKALIDLQWQYNNTDDGHIRTKTDIIEAIQRLQRELKLRRKSTYDGKQIKVLVTADTESQASCLIEMFEVVIGRDRVRSILMTSGGGRLETDSCRIEFISKNSPSLKGKRSDYRFDLY